MRRYIIILLLLAAATLTFESAVPTKMKESPAKNHQACTTYTWFEDQDLTAPVGTMCDIGVEIARLQNTYGGYAFQASPGGGLHPYEYGWHPYLNTAIIYSDR